MNQVTSYIKTKIFYTLATGLYFSGEAILFGYTVVFLTSCGVSDSVSGLVVSLSAIGAIIAQMIVANYLDKNPMALVKTPTIVVAVLDAAVIFAMLLMKDIPIAILILYMIGLIGMRTNLTLINSISVKSDIHIPFAVPRGFGSATYAFTCLLAGFIASRFGVSSIFYFYVPLAVFQAICLLIMPEDHLVPEDKDVHEKEHLSYITMISHNKILAVFLVSCIFNSIGMTACSTFLIRIIEECGGDSSSLGVILFIQAFAEVPMCLIITNLIKKFGLEKILTFSFLMFAVRCFLFSYATSVTMVAVISCLNMFCYGVYGIAYVQFPNLIVGDDERARAQALTSLCSSSGLGLVIGSAFAGTLVSLVGARTMFRTGGIVCAVGFVGMFICAVMVNKNKKLSEPYSKISGRSSEYIVNPTAVSK